MLEESLGHIDRQLELVRRRREDIDALERELAEKRQRAQAFGTFGAATALREASGVRGAEAAQCRLMHGPGLRPSPCGSKPQLWGSTARTFPQCAVPASTAPAATPRPARRSTPRASATASARR